MRRHAKALFAVSALLALFAFAPGANAARPYACQITASGTPSASECNTTGNTVPGGAFTNPFALAVDPADNLWVSDTGSTLVNKFDSDGNFLTQADGTGSWEGSAFVRGLAYGNAADLLYAADSNHGDLWGINPDGTYAGIDLKEGLGGGNASIYAAVDNSGGANDGDIYVSAGDRVVRIDASGAAKDFSASESYLSGNVIVGDPNFALAPKAIAVDGDGDVYVVNGNNLDSIIRYDSSGTFVRYYKESSFAGVFRSVLAVAVDPTNDHVLVGSSDNGLVYEFDTNGEFRGRVTGAGTPAGSFASIQGLAVDSGGRLWVADGGNGVVDAFGNFTPTGPVATTVDPITDFDARSAEFTGTVDSGTEAVKYRFEYSSDAGASWTQLPDQGPISGVGPQDVSAGVKDLQPNTTYEVRLFAFNEEGQVFSAAPNPSFTTDAVPPDVGVNASSASRTEAWLAGWVNPWGSPTTYHFEYGTAGPCSSNPCASTPGVSAGNGTKKVFAHSIVTNLNTNVEYHYRLIVTSLDGGTVVGPDRTVETSSASLPEGRAYEMVSPVTKNGTDVAVIPQRTQSAIDGNAIIYPSSGSFAGGLGNRGRSDYFARRGADGWLTHNITPPQGGEASTPLGSGVIPLLAGDASADLSKGVFFTAPFPGSSVVQKLGSSLYFRDDLDVSGPGAPALLNDCLAPPAGPCATPLSPFESAGVGGGGEFAFADASKDFDHIIFESRQNLVSDAVGDSLKLYEWDHGTIRLAGILPDGTPALCEPGRTCSLAGRGAGVSMPDTSESDPVYFGGGRYNRTDTTISADGSRVFFTTGPYSPNFKLLQGRLFMREDHQTTTQINVSERTDCSGDPTCGGDGQPDPQPDPSGPYGAAFGIATDDGSKVLFITDEQLTDDDRNSPSSSGNAYDIYLADLNAPAGERLALISKGSAGAPGSRTEPLIAGISADVSYVYFTFNQQLVAGQPALDGFEDGIFAWHQGQVRYLGIAKGRTGLDESVAAVASDSRGLQSGRLSADGHIFTFVNSSTGQSTGQPSQDLTGYDDQSSGERCATTNESGSQPGEGCFEAYAYDANSDALTCASCSPLGDRPSGDTEVIPYAYAGLSVGSNGHHYNRVLSDDGKHLFFSSPDPLVPRDTNGHYDAYVYDVESGQVRLLSTGQCNCDSYFVEASPDGKNAFFVTGERLVGIDTDKQADLYDARVGGGIAAQNPAPPFECQGDACQPTPTPPNDPTPASSAFSGAGNTTSQRGPDGRKCGKATRKVKRNGKTRCVAKKRTEKHGKRSGK